QIKFVINNPNLSDVQGRLYDVNGREVAELGLVSGGSVTTLSWDGRTSSGAALESGVYVYQITGDSSHIAGLVAVAR
ncbi:MAG: T9SS type A sorting domain-containing protein, partial [Elusimicrobia bacterium]|nr:T9SS type A sorting domain-containing protein [Elusimicrobiota bacterium]